MNSHSLDLESTSSQYATAADSASLSITSDMTIECWIKLETLPSVLGANESLVTKWNVTGNLRSYRMYIASANDKLTVKASIDGTEPGGTAVATTALTAGIWNHLAWVYDADGGANRNTFYLNGVTDGTDANTDGGIHDNSSQLGVGVFDHQTGAAQFLDSLIDEIRIWNDIRTAAEIANNYKREIDPMEQGLAAYWKLNNDYLDETANNNDLTAVGSPVFSTDIPFSAIYGKPFIFD